MVAFLFESFVIKLDSIHDAQKKQNRREHRRNCFIHKKNGIYFDYLFACDEAGDRVEKHLYSLFMATKNKNEEKLFNVRMFHICGLFSVGKMKNK